MFNVHALGGEAMMRGRACAGRAGRRASRASRSPLVLAVTVLSSQSGEALASPASLAFEAKAAGLDGVVVSGEDVEDVRDVVRRRVLLVVPGIRPAGSNGHDQVRVLTPSEAIETGADYLVIGRPITERFRSGRCRARDPARPPLSGSTSAKPQATRETLRLSTPTRAVRILAPSPPPGHRTEGAAYMPLPPSPRNSAQQALAKAAEARKKRAELKGELKSGKRTLRDVLSRSADDTVGKMKVSAVLESLPGVGKVRAQKLMEELDISASRRVRGLGREAARELLDRFARSKPAAPHGRQALRPRRPLGGRQGHRRPSSSLAHDPDGSLRLGLGHDAAARGRARSTASTTSSSTTRASTGWSPTGELLEWAEIFGHRSGTPARPIRTSAARAATRSWRSTSQGAGIVREQVPDAVLIFLVPPSLEELERRLRTAGTEDEEQLAPAAGDGRGGDGAGASGSITWS